MQLKVREVGAENYTEGGYYVGDNYYVQRGIILSEFIMIGIQWRGF